MIAYAPARHHFQIGQAPQVTPTPVPAVIPGPTPRPKASPAMTAGATILGVAWTGAAAWVGLRTATRESGLVSIAGWVGGIGAILAGVTILAAPLLGHHVPTPIDIFFGQRPAA